MGPLLHPHRIPNVWGGNLLMLSQKAKNTANTPPALWQAYLAGQHELSFYESPSSSQGGLTSYLVTFKTLRKPL